MIIIPNESFLFHLNIACHLPLYFRASSHFPGIFRSMKNGTRTHTKNSLYDFSSYTIYRHSCSTTTTTTLFHVNIHFHECVSDMLNSSLCYFRMHVPDVANVLYARKCFWLVRVCVRVCICVSSIDSF